MKVALPAEIDDFRARPLFVLLLLWLVWLVHGIDRHVLMVLLDPIGKEFSLSDTELGMVAGLAYALPFAIAGIPLGALVDRVNRKRFLIAILTVWSGCTMLLSLAQNFLTLVLFRATVGAAEAGAAPAITSMMADSCPPRARPAIMSALYTAPFAGMTIGAIAGSAIAANSGWRAAFLIAGSVGIVVALAMMLLLLEPARGKYRAVLDLGDDTPRPVREVIRMLLTEREVSRLTIGFVFGMLMVPAVMSWTALYLVRVLNLPVDQAGLATGGVIGLASAVGTLAGGVIVNRLFDADSPSIAAFCGWSIFAAIPLGMCAIFSDDARIAVGLLGAWALLTCLFIGPANSVIIGLIPSRTRGTAGAILAVGANVVGAGLGPQIIGLSSDALQGAGDEQSLRHALAAMIAFAFVPAFLLLSSSKLRRSSQGLS